MGKEFAYNAGDLGSIPGLGRSSGEEKGYPLQYSGLENSMAYSPWGCKEVDTTERLSLHFPLLVRNLTNIWEILRDQILPHSAGRLIPDQVKIFEKPP